MQNSQTQRLKDDNEDQNHRVKQLEINAHQFYSQLKPLFSENTQLKQNLIELNVYVEERKMQLCKFLSDTGPNGEDLILAKAVGDLQQICDLVGEEMIRLRNELQTFVKSQEVQKQTLKEVREQLQNEIKRSIDEKQQLINQNSTSQQIYKSQIDILKQQNEIHLMKIEDLYSVLVRKTEMETKLRNRYQTKLEEETNSLRQELNQVKLMRQEEIEKSDIERRVYLKQLEQFSGKMKQMRQDIIDEYEYKLANQKSKLDNQIKILQQENSELKLQLSQLREKYRLWTIQQEVLIDQKYKLEIQNKDLKNLISYLEEKLIVQEELSIQAQNELTQQKSTISQMKQSTNQKKKSITGTQIMAQQQQKQQSKSHTPVQDSRSSSGQLWQKASTAVKKLPRDSLKMMESQKYKAPEESKSQGGQILQKKNSFTQPTSSDEQFVEREKFKKLGSIQELHFEHISSATLSQRMDLKFVEASTQTEEISQTPIVPSSRGRISSVFRTRQQFVQQFSYNHVETQYESEQNDIDYINFKQDLLVSQLQNKLISTQQLCDLKLQQRNEDIQDLQKQLTSQQKLYESQLKQVEIELNLLHGEEQDKKIKEIYELKEKLEKAEDKIKGLEEAVRLFEQNQENIHQQYENKLNQKDQEIKAIEEKVVEVQLMAQQEQSRLLQLNQSQREQYQIDIKNLENQHLLDQEKIQQEKNRYLEEKQFIEQTRADNQLMIEQIKRKEFILDNYKSELIKTNEVVKYLQLELENYKKLNNIFKSRNESPPQFLANGFLSVEVQERIKSRLQKSKISKDNPKFGFQTRDMYGMNFQIQRKEKLKQAKLGALNTSFEDKSFSSASKNLLFKIKDNEGSQTLQVNSKRMLTDDNKIGFEIKKKPQHIKKNQRAKTQISDYSDSKLLINDIFEKEITVLNRSNQFLNQLSDQPTKFRSIHSTHQTAKKKFLQNR